VCRRPSATRRDCRSLEVPVRPTAGPPSGPFRWPRHRTGAPPSGVSMARITVEDCLKQIPNRFELTLAATYPARMLAQGHAPKVESRDKPTVTALREIAAGKVGIEMLRRVPT